MSDIDIEIDGKPLKAKPNSMVIQVADDAGIYIPRFCYHKHLSIAANCRMCLVEVEKAPKPLPACATPVMPGMKVFTKSPKALAAQKSVMEFLLINHPLDCPICDQGGECELQDLSMGFGSADSFYNLGKRAVKDENLGPLISTEMTRCIQCTRCVRFGDEIAGMRELGAVNRGEDMEIRTYVEKTIQSELSGNVIDICPVGALTSKPFRFTARAWELTQLPTIAAHDCLGSNIYAHHRTGKVMRIVPRENDNINQTWISDRDRFSYEGVNHVDRLQKPMIRVEDQWEEVDWQTALEYAVKGMQNVINSDGADQLAALASPNSTTEEFYLLQKLMRQLGSSHVDHRLRQVDFSDQADMAVFPGMNGSIADIENCDVIVLVGSHIQKEQPMAGARVRKATLKGARVIAMNMMDYRFNFALAAKNISAPHQFVAALADVANGKNQTISALLQEGKKIAVLLGAQAFNHPEAAKIRALATHIAQNNNATLGYLTEGANAAGAWLAGAVPHRKVAGESVSKAGLDAAAMWKNPRKAYLLLNVEPELDCANAPAALSALEQANFIVSLSAFKNPVLAQYAHVILPVAPFTETSGTYVNVTGEWQKFNGVATAVGESRPAWKVLRVFGNLFHCEGFDYTSSHEVHDELAALIAKMPASQSAKVTTMPTANAARGETITRIGEIPIYAGDAILRRAKALQATQSAIEGNLVAVRLHPATAAKLQVTAEDVVTVKQQTSGVRLPVIIDERIPEQAAYVVGAILATQSLTDLFGPIEIQKV